MATLLAAPAALADGPRRVGVVVALTVNATEERAVELSEALGAAIEAELAVEAIAGAEAEAKLPAAGIPDGCIADDACVRDLGGRLGADEILALVVVEMGDRTQIEPTWLDVATGRSVSRAAIAVPAGDDVTATFRRLAPQLVPGAERREPADTDAEAEERGEALDLQGQDPSFDGGSPEAGRRMTPAAWIAGGVGAAGLAAGTGFWLAARSLHNACARGGCEEREGPRIRRRAIAADVAFTTALVSGGVAAALYWWSGGGEAAPAVTVGPAAGGVGVSLGGRF